jgi:hypothetical protein
MAAVVMAGAYKTGELVKTLFLRRRPARAAGSSKIGFASLFIGG